MLLKTTLFLHFQIIQQAIQRVSKTGVDKFLRAAFIALMNFIFEWDL